MFYNKNFKSRKVKVNYKLLAEKVGEATARRCYEYTELEGVIASEKEDHYLISFRNGIDAIASNITFKKNEVEMIND